VAQDIPLSVTYEDEALIVVDKPAGLVVHPAAGNLDGTLVNALLHHCRGQLSGIGGVARPGIVHRIDKDTSGLLVVAKRMLRTKGWRASLPIIRSSRLQGGHRRPAMPAAGTITGAIARSVHDRKKMALVQDGRGKHAVTHYRTLARLDGAALVECRLETGRTHQVRVHLASIGHSLLGDPVYGRAPAKIRPPGPHRLCPTGAACGRTGVHSPDQRRNAPFHQPDARRYAGTDCRIGRFLRHVMV
jgi:23S rRNA pseudouridine1911/1915/1917 synthase